MNATQIQTGGVRKTLGRRIEEWLGGRAIPARGRTRTKAALAVENLEGRVVLSVTPAQLQGIASLIVDSAEIATANQPQNFASAIDNLDSPQKLPTLLNAAGIQPSGNNAQENNNLATVESFVETELLNVPKSIPSADVLPAMVNAACNMLVYQRAASSTPSNTAPSTPSNTAPSTPSNPLLALGSTGITPGSSVKTPSISILPVQYSPTQGFTLKHSQPVVSTGLSTPGASTHGQSTGTQMTSDPSWWESLPTTKSQPSTSATQPQVMWGGANETWAVEGNAAQVVQPFLSQQSGLNAMPGNVDPND